MLKVYQHATTALLFIAMPSLAQSQSKLDAQERVESAQTNLENDRDLQQVRVDIETSKVSAAMSVRELILTKLSRSSDTQVELANIARERFENEQLNAYTKQVIDDHAMLKKALVAALTVVGSSEGTSSPRPRISERRNVDQRDNGRAIATSTERVAQRSRGLAGREARQQVPSTLCQIIEQAGENNLRMTSEMLGAYEGQDFQMAFLGQQAVALTMALAELEAIQASASFQDLKPIVQQAISITERHVDLAKHLAGQFENDH